MTLFIRRTAWVALSAFIVAAGGTSQEARAVGILYANPGWLHAFDGSSAYYHDPDGPNPNYRANPDPTNNQPGGQGNSPALIPPPVPCGGTGQPSCESVAIWQISGSQWEGSAPGAPLGGTPTTNTALWPVPPPAPGGVGAFTEGSTTFIRIQDPGFPQPWGWPDKGAQFQPGAARQEGNNRRIQFKHEMNRDAGFSGTPAIIDNGVTLSFRARIATRATGPLDDIFPEDASSIIPWPTEGVGYPIGNNGRGMVMLTQTGSSGPTQLAFSLLDSNAITANGLSISRTGLVMNNAGPATGPDTGDANATTLNIVDIPNEELTNWHEFWITVQKLPTPINGSTHEVKVYMDGSLTPSVFNVILGNQNEFGSGSHLGLGLSSGSRFGAFDLDFIAYREGVIEPTLATLAGDYNGDGKVDAADFVLWRKNPAAHGGNPDGYNNWRANFGAMSGSGSSAAFASLVPEPGSFLLLTLSVMVALVRWRAR